MDKLITDNKKKEKKFQKNKKKIENPLQNK
jgi:hypothetical protein